MVELEKKTLRQCLSLIIDNRGKTPKKTDAPGGYRILSANHVKSDGLVKTDSIGYGSESTYEQWMSIEIERGDIILTSEAPAGEVMLWDSDEKVIIAQRLFCLRVNPKLANNKYIKYYLQSPTGQKEITRNTSGSTVFGISARMFDQINVHLPKNTFTQNKIGSLLHLLDNKIEINNRINAQLEAMAKTLYDYWFVQFEFPDANGKPYKTAGGKMVYNPTVKLEIPEDWSIKALSQIANITMGQSPEGESYNEEGNGTVFFQGSTDFGWLFPTTRQYTTEPARMAKKGDILLSVRAPVGDMNIAKVDCCIGRGLAALNSKTSSDGFLFYVMKYFKQIFDRRNSAGKTFGSITKDDLHSLELVYPDSTTLKKYDAIVSKYNQMIYQRSLENEQLVSLRDWLLPMLMNGQVTVK